LADDARPFPTLGSVVSYALRRQADALPDEIDAHWVRPRKSEI
jgi:hypothetical protein